MSPSLSLLSPFLCGKTDRYRQVIYGTDRKAVLYIAVVTVHYATVLIEIDRRPVLSVLHCPQRCVVSSGGLKARSPSSLPPPSLWERKSSEVGACRHP